MKQSQAVHTRVVLIALLTWLAVAASGFSRAEGRLYDIELVVFQNLLRNDGGEVWPRDESLWRGDLDRQSEHTQSAQVNWLGKPYRLAAHYEALRRSAQYRPVAHFAWRQAVFDRAQATSMDLPANVPTSGAHIDGSVRVAVERYLHLHLDLQLHDSVAPATVTSLEAHSAPSADAEPQSTWQSEPPATPEFRLRETRRMRSKELHYFDHPRFGALALITPYSPDEADQEATDTGASPTANPP
jgi:hypothetical protein